MELDLQTPAEDFCTQTEKAQMDFPPDSTSVNELLIKLSMINDLFCPLEFVQLSNFLNAYIKKIITRLVFIT